VIVRKTPASNTTGERWLVVVQHVDRALINTTQYFVYRQNPHVIDIFPLTHLLRYAYFTTSQLLSRSYFAHSLTNATRDVDIVAVDMSVAINLLNDLRYTLFDDEHRLVR